MISKLRLEDLKTVTFYFWTLQEDHIPHKETFTYLLEPFSSFLHVWPYWHQVSHFHACKGLIFFQSQLVPVSSPRLLELNILKAVGRTQIEGSCKVYAGKTNWITSWKLYPCTLASKKWGALEALLQMTLYSRNLFTSCKACDIVAEDACSVASQHSIGLIDIKWGTFMRPPSIYVTWYVGEMPTCPSENSQFVPTECLESSRQDTDRGKLQGVCGKG